MILKTNRANKLITNLGLGIILTLAAGLNSSTFAQSQYERDNGYQSNEKDSIYGDAPGGLNPVDLIHRAQQQNRRSTSEFEADSQGQLNNSVSDFKRMQQQKILEQQQSPTEPAENKQ